MTAHMLNLVRHLARAGKFKNGPVLEIGSYIEKQQDHLNMRSVFDADAQFVGTDVNPGPGVDKVMDLLNRKQIDELLGEISPRAILCLYTLEHAWEIHEATANLAYIWQKNPNAWLIVSTHQNQPFHGTENYGDFWRLTLDGLHRLMTRSGIPAVHLMSYPVGTNPEDVVAIRPPMAMGKAKYVEILEEAMRPLSAEWYVR